MHCRRRRRLLTLHLPPVPPQEIRTAVNKRMLEALDSRLSRARDKLSMLRSNSATSIRGGSRVAPSAPSEGKRQLGSAISFAKSVEDSEAKAKEAKEGATPRRRLASMISFAKSVDEADVTPGQRKLMTAASFGKTLEDATAPDRRQLSMTSRQVSFVRGEPKFSDIEVEK